MGLILSIAAGIILALFILANARAIMTALAWIALLAPPALAAIYLATAPAGAGDAAGEVALIVLLLFGLAIVMGLLARFADWP